mmetsp:Transcript_93213/g.295682  ORF Transcript_93213/g.295682 Transcript_93213/m.295682 type:complete len:235 (+) Transcript_93213:479-1183(+)
MRRLHGRRRGQRPRARQHGRGRVRLAQHLRRAVLPRGCLLRPLHRREQRPLHVLEGLQELCGRRLAPHPGLRLRQPPLAGHRGAAAARPRGPLHLPADQLELPGGARRLRRGLRRPALRQGRRRGALQRAVPAAVRGLFGPGAGLQARQVRDQRPGGRLRPPRLPEPAGRRVPRRPPLRGEPSPHGVRERARLPGRRLAVRQGLRLRGRRAAAEPLEHEPEPRSDCWPRLRRPA